MSEPFISRGESSTRSSFLPVSLSLADLCGEGYARAVCANHAVLTGEAPTAAIESAFKRVEFFPLAFERHLLQLLPKVGQKVGTRLGVFQVDSRSWADKPLTSLKTGDQVLLHDDITVIRRFLNKQE